MTTSGYVQTMREDLGLTGEEMAGQLGVNPRTLRAWESGRDLVPDRIEEEVAGLVAERDSYVSDLVTEWLDEDLPPVARVWRTDAEMHAARPDLYTRPARWWRHIVARACTLVEGVTIVSSRTVIITLIDDETGEQARWILGETASIEVIAGWLVAQFPDLDGFGEGEATEVARAITRNASALDRDATSTSDMPGMSSEDLGWLDALHVDFTLSEV